VLAALAAAAWQACAAFGADSLYWNNEFAGAAIRVGNLAGSGASSLFPAQVSPYGIAIDIAAGKIYWADFTEGKIRMGNLDGSGTPTDLFTGEDHPDGVAIDPAAGKIYWGSAVASGAIRVGNLNGSGTPSTLFSSESFPDGVAIDPAGGKIYWADDVNPGAIRVGNLNGSGGAHDLFSGENDPATPAIDPAGGKIYWAESIPTGGVRVGNLNGTGTATDLFPGESDAYGLAVDPEAGKLYWSRSSRIRVGNLNGTSATDLFTGESPSYLGLLRSPLGAGAPAVSGGGVVGSILSCSSGSWAPDVLGAFLFRVPRSFSYQWSLNGKDIAGATSSSYTPSAAGSYTCRVTASNQAGSTSQTSASFSVTTIIAKVRQSHRRWREGTALPHVASARPPVGTTFRFTVSQSVRVRFAFKQRLRGRLVPRGTLSFGATAGAHKLRFQGRLSKHKKLPPGHYVLVITATNSSGQSASARLTFTIVA
jgi:hypothetical protein